MNATATEIHGVYVANTTVRFDARGSFARLFCAASLRDIIGLRSILQINRSCTQKKGTVRGMHFQVQPHCEMKLVRCLRGRVFDVALDLRRGSPTLLRWHAQILSPENESMMIIPEGCAHGFQALEDETELLYLHTAAYVAASESGVRPTDLLAAIQWPLPITEISERDRNHPTLTETYSGLTI